MVFEAKASTPPLNSFIAPITDTIFSTGVLAWTL
jgi:hypothetical protein